MTIRKNAHTIVMVTIIIAFILLIRPALAQESPSQGGVPQATATQATEPQPDPAGIATGAKADAIDGAGNAFVVTEPTDTKASDYAEKKKQYQEYKEQAAKEPLALKLADTVGHVRRGCAECGADESWRDSNTEPFPVRKRHVGFLRRQGLFSERSGLRFRKPLPHALRSSIHGDSRVYHRGGYL